MAGTEENRWKNARLVIVAINQSSAYATTELITPTTTAITDNTSTRRSVLKSERPASDCVLSVADSPSPVHELKFDCNIKARRLYRSTI